MAKYMVWHPRHDPEEFEYIENAVLAGIEKVKESKGARRNNVLITREDVPTIAGRAPIVVVIRGYRIE